MIWFDLAIILLLTIRIAVIGATVPRLPDPENPSSVLASGVEEDSLRVTNAEADEAYPPSDISLPNAEVLQLHIYVMPDLKGAR